MKRGKAGKTTVTVRLTEQEHEVLQRLCALKHTSRTGYLTQVATLQAKKELLNYAVEEFTEGRASLSECSTHTGIDVPTIMDEVARVKEEDNRGKESFLSAVKTLSKVNKDPAFYTIACKALR